MSHENEAPLFFGFPEEFEQFHQRHPLWAERFSNLTHAIGLAFTRTQTMSEPEDKLVYFYGKLCAEDFMEILLICGNGYGAAAMKLLRCMYEHAVTLRYLHDHPDDASAFMDYHHVQQHKLAKSIIETFGGDALSESITEDVEQKYAQVKDQFIVTDCKKCGTTRINNTWKMDFVSMAKKAGAIGTLVVPGYFLPLRHAHATFGALEERLEIVDDRMGFKADSQPEMADDALRIAHNCILNALDVQKERFKIDGLEEQLQTCFHDYLEIWITDAKPLDNSDQQAPRDGH
jgi:hypothetical protein